MFLNSYSILSYFIIIVFYFIELIISLFSILVDNFLNCSKSTYKTF